METENRQEQYIDKTVNQDKRKYRLVCYYNQWPQGDDYKVIADNLTLEEAEKLQKEESLGLTTERFEIEPSDE
ncbi:MAG: hypothetical protein ACXVCY_03005 [Pseudobdellovibrionaceae bacterium]